MMVMEELGAWATSSLDVIETRRGVKVLRLSLSGYGWQKEEETVWKLFAYSLRVLGRQELALAATSVGNEWGCPTRCGILFMTIEERLS
jgi:hypothetical protein